MTLSARRNFIGTAVLLAAIGSLSLSGSIEAADGTIEISDADLKALIEQDAKYINDNIKGGSPEKKHTLGIVSSSVMIASYAQSRITGKDKETDLKYATLRDNALKVAKAIKSKKGKEAVEPAKLLTAEPVADKAAVAKTVDVAKETKIDIDDLMAQFKKSGLGLEDVIKAQSKKAGKPEDVSALATRMKVVAAFMESVHSEFGGTKKTEKAWVGYNTEMKTASDDLLKAAGAKDAKKIQTAFTKLDGACTNCHNTFK